MSPFKNIAIVGASGGLGKILFERLVASEKFNIKVLRRLGSSATFPAGTDVVDVDFDSAKSIEDAFAGRDAVVSAVGAAALTSQKALIDAAIAAGVKRFIPSEFGSDLDNPNARKLPVFGYKVQVQDYLFEKAKASGITYTLLYCAAFLEWGLEQDFFLKVSNYEPEIINGGDNVFSVTSLASVGDGLVGILSHPQETQNRSVRIEDIKLSQNKILSLAKQLAPNKPWQIKHSNLDDLTAAADAALAAGDYSQKAITPYLWRASLDPTCGGNFEETDNELLSIKGKTDKDVLELLKPLLK